MERVGRPVEECSSARAAGLLPAVVPPADVPPAEAPAQKRRRSRAFGLALAVDAAARPENVDRIIPEPAGLRHVECRRLYGGTEF
jgi:hypothetical protein